MSNTSGVRPLWECGMVQQSELYTNGAWIGMAGCWHWRRD